MEKQFEIILYTTFLSLATSNVLAHEDMYTSENSVHEAKDHGTEHSHTHQQHSSSTFGRSGDPGKVDQTIEMQALDIMKYDKEEIFVKTGETVQFIVTNTGKLRHEFMIGDQAEQNEHAQMMKSMPNMVHEDANALTLEPEQTKTLVWQFTKPGIFEIACHIPGHYEAGMVSKVHVK